MDSGGFPLLAVATVFRQVVLETSSSVDMPALGTVVATALQFAPVSDPEAGSRQPLVAFFRSCWYFSTPQLEEEQLRAVLEGIFTVAPALSLVPTARQRRGVAWGLRAAHT